MVSKRGWLAATAGIAALSAATLGQAKAETAPALVPPPLSFPKAAFFNAHPEAFKQFITALAQQHAAAGRLPARAATTSTTGGTWHTVTKAPSSLCNPILLTDGSVIAANGTTPDWYKLTPDSFGRYEKGTWTQIASLPIINGVQYAPLYHSSAVLPDGRVIIMGGEYNGHKAVWTNLGAIYDPVANTWTPVHAPLGTLWQQIGDSQGVVLASGQFLQAACCAYHPPADALFNAKQLSWTTTGAPHGGDQYQDEQGYELLPNGNVLTIDVWTPTVGGPVNAEQYTPATRKWTSAGIMPLPLVDPVACGNYEIGPAALRGDGTVVAFGGNTGCVAGATNDPTDLYNTATGTWSAGPYIPATCGTDGATSCTLADAPAAVLPDGNILFAASSGYGAAPTHFFEFSATNSISQVPDTVKFASTSGAYYYNFLVLPTGQVLSTDFSSIAELYTPANPPVSAWAPVITKAPTKLIAGKVYTLSGTQLNGVTQGAYYGDDAQMATNYPIVRVFNAATGSVVYARTSGFSSMGVAPGTAGTVKFTLPAGTVTGPGNLEVIANGIASATVGVTVEP